MSQASLLDALEVPVKPRKTRSVPLNIVTPSATITKEKKTVSKSLKELLAAQAEIAEQIQLARLEATTKAWKEIDLLMQEHGITADALVQHYAPSKVKQKFTRKPAAAKYAFGGVEWTGRGRAPRVIQAELDRGTPLEKLVINKSF